MIQHLTGISRLRAIVAKWIILNIAYKLSPLAVMSLCLEMSRLYYENIEGQEEK
jgi:hypothetical protein